MASRKAGLGFIVVTLFIDILGLGLIIPILPRLVESFVGNDPGRGAFYVGALASAYALMQFIFSPIMGSLSDRFGRRPVLLVSLFGTGFDYVLLAFAPSLAWFFLGRVVSGLCGASIGTAAAYIADVSPPEKRAQNFGLIGMAFGLGFIAGPLLSALLGDVAMPLPHFISELTGYTVLPGIRFPFVVAALLSFTNAMYGLFVLPESLKLENRRAFSWARANPIGTLSALTKYPVVLGLALTLFLVGVAQRSLESTWVLFTEYRFHWDIKDTGISLAVVGLAAAIVQGGLVRRIIPKLGERKALTTGIIVSSIAFALYGLASAGWMLYVFLVFGSLGGIAGPAAQGLMSKSVPPNEQGMLQGGLASVTSITSVLGPLIATNLFGFFISDKAPVKIPGAAFFAGSGLLVLALFAARRTFARVPAPSPGAPVVSSPP
ncbi:MAG: TCR/Tet family MFS transporter [Archangium sp.]|nr:TCR/Tet family MFS transporter [Archangium sp.]MDP3151250.1 TCR/Tet family MFS transporter [Archangium sp.]MDP3570109.1 TCR/Tet family MFS transporter [Archangium sp.]